MSDDIMKKDAPTNNEEGEIMDDELEMVAGGVERPKPPTAPGIGSGM